MGGHLEDHFALVKTCQVDRWGRRCLAMGQEISGHQLRRAVACGLPIAPKASENALRNSFESKSKPGLKMVPEPSREFRRRFLLIFIYPESVLVVELRSCPSARNSSAQSAPPWAGLFLSPEVTGWIRQRCRLVPVLVGEEVPRLPVPRRIENRPLRLADS